MAEACCVSDQYCEAPANGSWGVRSKCFVCGLHVCSACSSRRKYRRYGRVRMCNECQIQHDGNDDVVMARLHKQAGY